MSKTVQELCDEFKLNREDYKLKLNDNKYLLDTEKSIFENGLIEHYKELDFDTYAKLRIIELLKHQNEVLDSISAKLWDED